MNEPVTLLLLQHLFPAWTITRNAHGTWTAAGRVHVSSSEVDRLLAELHIADPDAVHRAVSLLQEC